MPRSAIKVTPTIKNDVLYADDDSTGTAIGSAEWFDWLETATTFYYQGAVGTFTGKREKRRGSFYWFAIVDQTVSYTTPIWVKRRS